MHQALKENIIIFNHIPKAGGTSLTRLFEDIFGPDACFRHRKRDPETDKHSPSISSLSEEQINSYRFFSGHFNYGNHKILQTPYKYISVVRDPIDRLISDYYFNRERGSRDLQELCNSMDLVSYAEHKKNLKNSKMARSSQIEFVTNQGELDIAKKIIDRDYLMCCSVPQLDDMQKIIADMGDVNLQTPIDINKSKRSAQESEVEEIRSILGGNYQIDYALISYIEQKFEDEYKERYAKVS